MNPYTPKSSQLFYGRQQIMRNLLADEQQGQSIVLIGGRRCGKTRIPTAFGIFCSGLGTAPPMLQPCGNRWHRIRTSLRLQLNTLHTGRFSST